VAALVPAPAQAVAMKIDRAVSGGLLPGREPPGFQPGLPRDWGRLLGGL
jgi:hypothetical protein